MPSDAPAKLLLTVEAVAWREKDGSWEPRPDPTIARQFQALPALLRGAKSFEAQHSEDYPHARAFECMSSEEGQRRWPQLRGHESDRIAAMEDGLAALPQITSQDHRVVEAVAARSLRDGLIPQVQHPEAVDKSWPQFWDALGQLAT